jgi:uncharacterized protein (DUF433 family)
MLTAELIFYVHDDAPEEEAEGADWSLKPDVPAPPERLMALHGSDWARTSGLKALSAATEWYIQSQLYGLVKLRGIVEVDPERRGGVPVLRGTRFPVAQVLAELAETEGAEEVAENFDLEARAIRDLLNAFSLLLHRPYGK